MICTHTAYASLTCDGLRGDIFMQCSLLFSSPTLPQHAKLQGGSHSLLLRFVGSVIPKGGDTENLGQPCDRQLSRGTVDSLLYSTQSSTVGKRRNHEVHHTTDSLMYTHPHPYLVVLHRGEGRRPQYTRNSVQGIVQLHSMLPTWNSPIGLERLSKNTVDSYY